MKIRVRERTQVSYEGRVYAAGETLTVDDDTGRDLVRQQLADEATATTPVRDKKRRAPRDRR